MDRLKTSLTVHNVCQLAFGQFGDFFDHCAALLSTSSGYKPIFLDSMELVAIEQASIVHSRGARTALERSAHVDRRRRHHCRARAACCAAVRAVPTVAGTYATPPPPSTSY